MKLLAVKWCPTSGENPSNTMLVPAGDRQHRPHSWEQCVIAEIHAAFNSQDAIGAGEHTWRRTGIACDNYELMQSNRRVDAIRLAELRAGIAHANAIADAFAEVNGLN